MNWSEEKVLILKDEYEYADLDLLARKVGTTVKAVRRKAEKLNLRRAVNNQVIDGYKYCSLCKVEHDISSFYKNKAKSNGYEYYCKKYYKSKLTSSNSIKSIKPLLYSQKGGNATDRVGHSSKRPRNPTVVKNNIQGKVCNKCKVWKSLDLYWNSKNGIAGKRAVCIDCSKR